jgi:hypothetical protein
MWIMASDRYAATLPRRPRRARFWSAAAAAALLVFASTVSAGEPTAAEKDTARSMMNAGDRAFQAQDYAAALDAYKAAHAIMGIPNTGIWVAKTQALRGQLVEARDTALTVARMPATPGEHPIAARSRTEAEDLARELAARIPSIVVQVEGGGPDVAVQINGISVPRESLVAPWKVNPGKHTAKASAPGHREAVGEVTLKEGDTVTVKLRLIAAEAAPAPGKKPEITPDAPSAAPPNDAGGFRMSPLVWIGLGVGAAGLAVGGITGILALSKAGDATDHCTGNVCTAEAQDPIDQSDLFANVSNVGFGVGVLGFGLGVLGLVLANNKSNAPRDANATALQPTVTPMIGVGVIGVRGAL